MPFVPVSIRRRRVARVLHPSTSKARKRSNTRGPLALDPYSCPRKKSRLRRGTRLFIFAMAEHSRARSQLCECFRGRVPKRADWMSVLALANDALTTTALKGFVTRLERQIPEDVCHHVREMFERNVAQ